MLSICSLWRTKRDLRIHALGEKSRKKENPKMPQLCVATRHVENKTWTRGQTTERVSA